MLDLPGNIEYCPSLVQAHHLVVRHYLVEGTFLLVGKENVWHPYFFDVLRVEVERLDFVELEELFRVDVVDPFVHPAQME